MMDFLHSANIIVHVLTGTFALLLGLIALIAKKGRSIHNKSGLLFLSLLSFVIATGLIGVFVFGRNNFLLVITLLSAYQGFSGYRILKAKSNKPHLMDIVTAIITLLSASFFMFYLKGIGLMWSPIIIFSTIGWLLFIITYDFVRYFIPEKNYKGIWFYEHIIKMIGALGAIASAFSGTVFPQYQPYSQFIPSLIGILLMIGFVSFYISKKSRPVLSRKLTYES